MHKTLKITLVLLAVIFLTLPIGMMKGGSEEAPAFIEEKGLESGSDSITVEKVASEEVNGLLAKADREQRDLIGLEIAERDHGSHFFGTSRLIDDMDLVYASDPYHELLTRASDDEKDQYYMDMYNGSEITSTPETILGTLDLQSTSANSDFVDWYKINVSNVDPRAGTNSNIANFTITLESYEASPSSDDDLYELKYVDDGAGGLELESNYADFLEITIYHHDYWNGLSMKGGYEFPFDDGDDFDKWYHDGNWTFNWRADLRSEGTKDTNGLGNGLSELNWYYIAIRWNYLMKSTAPDRDPFEMDYQFTLSAPTMQNDNIYANDWKNATHLQSSVSSNLSSLKDQDDWFEIKGTNYSRIWDIDFWWNRTVPADLEMNPWSPTVGNVYRDVWINFYLVYSNWGVDETWGTSDDGWNASHITYSFYIRATNFISGDSQGNLINAFSGDLVNNMTGGEAGQRKIYMGVIIEPILIFTQFSQIVGLAVGTFGANEGYSINVSINEVVPNTPPNITDVKVTSTNPQHEAGGNYDDEFEIIATYQDDDDNPPNEIWLEIDPGSGNDPINITSSPVDVFDADYTDGKQYRCTFSGRELTDDPQYHMIKVWAKDKLVPGGLQVPKWSDPFVLENVLRVWDNDPPTLNPAFPGFTPLTEDSGEIMQVLGGSGGLFLDTEGFTGFKVWNETKNDWDNSTVTDMLEVNIVNQSGIWKIGIKPLPQRHGMEILKIMGFDEYMSVNGSFSISVLSVNDPPIVLHLEIDGNEFEVDNTDPTRPIIHLEDLEVMEDEEFNFTIVAVDGDLVEEWQPLDYSFRSSFSDNWNCEVSCDYKTGGVSFTPGNQDVIDGNSKMSFEITDNGEGGKIILDVFFKITNVNDIPSIDIPTDAVRIYSQFEKIEINVTGNDIDRNDILMFQVNMITSIGNGTDPVYDQLPFTDLQEGLNWFINRTTGEFWFQLDDQNIWRTDAGMIDQVEITLVFKVSDKDNASVTKEINLLLQDVNERPVDPTDIHYLLNESDVKGLTVNFWVEPISDPDEDDVVYKWDFGDGSTGEGREVTHEYSSEGYKTIKMWAEDQEFATDGILTILELIDLTKVDRDGDGIPDMIDEFPDDPTEWNDKDKDGYGDNGDTFPDDPAEWNDTDEDGYGDNGDIFPDDPAEWNDTDEDGYGDNSDVFPEDQTEWSDTDNDGVGDNTDDFPNNIWASVDTDGDGYPDELHELVIAEEPDLEVDEYPNDPSRWKKEEKTSMIFVAIMIIIIIAIILMLILFGIGILVYSRRSKDKMITTEE